MHKIFKTEEGLTRDAKIIVHQAPNNLWYAYAEGWEEDPQGVARSPSDALRDLADVLEDEE